MAKKKQAQRQLSFTLARWTLRLRQFFRGLMTRQTAAYFLMFTFVSCTSVGAFNVYAPAGWITLGVTSGVFGYILGSE